MKTHSTTHGTQRLVLIALFSAICYVTLFFKIPIPAPVGSPFLHMGNMFVILASLLFSGTIGGLSGSIGMGLFDMLNGWASSAPKTIVLKFGIGFITGSVAAKGHRADAKSPIKWLIAAASAFLVAGIALWYAAFTQGHEISIPGIEKTFVVIPALYIGAIVLSILLFVSCAYIRKIDIKLQYAILGAVAGILFNIVGEFLFGVISLLLVGSTLTPALISSAISLPATVINGAFSIIVAISLYIPLSKLVARLRF